VDENFNEDIVDGLTRRDATLEFTHVADAGLAAAPDPTILEWAGMRGLVLLTLINALSMPSTRRDRSRRDPIRAASRTLI
jgi:Domain of unknown function (DUF5615)